MFSWVFSPVPTVFNVSIIGTRLLELPITCGDLSLMHTMLKEDILFSENNLKIYFGNIVIFVYFLVVFMDQLCPNACRFVANCYFNYADKDFGGSFS